jgi:hypothetical protein
MTAVVRRLPFGLAEIVPASLLGFVVINSFTFAVDLGLLTTLHGGLRWPLLVRSPVVLVDHASGHLALRNWQVQRGAGRRARVVVTGGTDAGGRCHGRRTGRGRTAGAARCR